MTPEDARRRFANLKAMYGHVRGPKFLLDTNTVLRLHDVEMQLLAAIERDSGPGPDHDGFPSGHEGQGGEYAPLSSTEAGALGGYRLDSTNVEVARGSWVEPVDHHHKLTEDAVHALEQLDQAWVTLLRRLEAIRTETKVFKFSNPGGTCDKCGRWVEGTANDRLRRGLCPADHRAWLRDGSPPVTWVRLPNGDERLTWEESA